MWGQPFKAAAGLRPGVLTWRTSVYMFLGTAPGPAIAIHEKIP